MEPASSLACPRGGGPFHLSELFWQCFEEAYAGGAILPVAAGDARLRLIEMRERLGPLRFRTLQSATNLQTCYYDLEGPEPAPEEMGSLPARLLRGSGVHQLRFDWLREASRLLDAARAWRGRYLTTIDHYATSPVVDCRGTFEDYLARAGKSVRKYWRTCRREVLERGTLEVEFVTGGPGLAELLSAMFDLEASGWKGRDRTAILCSLADTRFYTGLAFAAAEAGALRIALLKEEGRLLAFEYCIVADGIVAAMKVGYDESRAKLQPGHLLALMNIRDACATPGLDWYDMLGNGLRVADYKRRFATDYWPVHRVRVFARSPLGLLLYAAFRARPRVKALRDRLRGRGRRGGDGAA
jgi:CelD/BcsL family acetyltransferase involved in cellulose biosynthesis